MSNNSQWIDPDGQINNTGSSTEGVYLIDPVTRKAISPATVGGGGGAVTIADGADVAQGTTTDAANANTIIGQLKQAVANLASIIGALDDGQENMANSISVAIASDQSTIPVSAASLPLPTGAATDANLVNILADTADIESNTANIPPLGQATMAASVPVAIASNQTTMPTLDSNSAAIKSDLDNINTNTGNIPAKGQATMANSTPVVIASNQTPVSENLSQVGGSNVSLGQTTMSASIPVAIASDQSGVKILPNYTLVYSTTQTGISASGDSGDLDLSKYRSLHLLANVTSLTGTSVQFKIQDKDAAGNYYSEATGTALVATGTSILSLGPGCTTNAEFSGTGKIQWVLVAVTSTTFTVALYGK